MIEGMTLHEFYLKYFRVQDSAGNWVAPAFREVDAAFFEIYDVANELGVEPFLRNYARMTKPRFVINPVVAEELERRKSSTTK